MSGVIARLYAEIGVDTSKLKSGLSDAKSDLATFNKGLAALGLGAISAGAALGVLAGAVKWSTTEAMQAEVADVKLVAVLQAGGKSAGMMKDQLKYLAYELQNETGVSDETVLSAEAMLKTFHNISTNSFPRAMRAAMDLSTVMDGDLRGAILQVGKALESPKEGLAALTRLGVRFSDEQQDVIAKMMAAGDAAGAQGLILKELETRFGGASRAMGSTFQGELSKLGETFGNVGERIGSDFLPPATEAISTLEKAIRLTLQLNSINRGYADGVRTGADAQREANFAMATGADQSRLLGKQVEGVNTGMAELVSFRTPEWLMRVGGSGQTAAAGLKETAEALRVYQEAWKGVGEALPSVKLPGLPEPKTYWQLAKEVQNLGKFAGESATDQHAFAGAIADMTMSVLEAKDPLFALKMAIGDLHSKDIYIRTFLKTFGATLTAAERAELAGTDVTTYGCFIAGNMVAAPAGDKPIESLVEGDRILAYSLPMGKRVVSRVIKTFTTVRGDLVSVRTAEGTIMGVSPEHPFLTTTGAIIGAAALLGLFLVTKRGSAEALSVEPYLGEHRVYNVEIEHPNHLYFVNGHVVHNKQIAEGSDDVPTGLHSVGERGEEGLFVGPDGKVMVIPANKWNAMKRKGMKPSGGFAGGIQEDPGAFYDPGGRHKPQKVIDEWNAAHEGTNPVPTEPAAPAPPPPSPPVSEAATVMLQQQTEKAARDAASQLQELKRIAQGVDRLNTTMPTVARDIAQSAGPGGARY